MKARRVRASAQVPDERLKSQYGRWKLTPIASRDNPNDKRPRKNENVCKRSDWNAPYASVVLDDLEPVTRDNVFWCEKATILDKVRRNIQYGYSRATISNTGIPTVINRSVSVPWRSCRWLRCSVVSL